MAGDLVEAALGFGEAGRVERPEVLAAGASAVDEVGDGERLQVLGDRLAADVEGFGENRDRGGAALG